MKNKKPPKKVTNCTTHFYGCACREYKYKHMETALRVIHTWCTYQEGKYTNSDEIARMCEESLLCRDI
jgi:hypothetical protein